MRLALPLFVLLLAWPMPDQDARVPIIVSRDEIAGPLGGEHHHQELKIFSDGSVSYFEKGSVSLFAGDTTNSFELQLTADEMKALQALLDSKDVRSIPKKISPKTSSIDFSWQKSYAITRPDKTQQIEIVNFYPFLNLHHDAYPRGVIEMECSLQDIERRAAKRPAPAAKDDWCRDMAEQMHIKDLPR
jgi:hypothetical protein